MTNPREDIEELKTLQQEREKLQGKRNNGISTAESSAAVSTETQKTDGEGDSPPVQADAVEPSPEPEKVVRELTLQIEKVVKELEDTAKERPVLALLATFAIGIVVGQLLTRR